MKKILAVFTFLFLFSISLVYASQDILIPTAAYTTTQSSADQVKSQENKAHFIINVTSVAGGGATITPVIEGKDYNGNYYTILQGLAISTTGITILKVGPGIGQVANAASNDYLPDIYRIRFTVSGAGSFTYGVTINRGQ